MFATREIPLGLTEQGKLPPETTRLSKATVKTLRKPVIYLTRAELDTLEGYPFPIGSDEDRARDFFVFCAYSSLRYSYASRLMKSMVSQTHIEINAEKTGTLLRIDLNSHTRRILEKYSQSPSPLALPRITVARLNVLIKKIGQTCGFDSPVTVEQYYGSQRKARTLPKWELLSSHAARRTFVVTALSRGIAPNIVMKWTGHSDYQAMLPYIDIADREKANAMALMD